MRFKLLLEYANDVAKQMRDELKKHGYKVPKQISVRTGRGGYSSSWHVEIKDMKISKEEIEKIVKKHEYIDYDERSGEILSGGNSFVFVDYDYDAEENTRKLYADKTCEVIKECLKRMGEFVNITKDLSVCYPFGCSYEGNNIDDLKPKGRVYDELMYEYVVKYKGKNIRDTMRGKDPLWMILVRYGVEP